MARQAEAKADRAGHAARHGRGTLSVAPVVVRPNRGRPYPAGRLNQQPVFRWKRSWRSVLKRRSLRSQARSVPRLRGSARLGSQVLSRRRPAARRGLSCIQVATSRRNCRASRAALSTTDSSRVWRRPARRHTLELISDVHYHDEDPNAYNVFADLPGRDGKAGFVMAGAHSTAGSRPMARRTMRRAVPSSWKPHAS